jgi:hypothetical protein
MDSFIKWMNGQTRLVKILFCLPVIDILWGVYRLLGAIKNKNMVHLILAIVWIACGPWFGWILDLVSVIFVDHIFWFVE